jgi:hypothetical protein
MKKISVALLSTVALAQFSEDEAYTSRQIAVNAACYPNILDHTFEQFAVGFVPTTLIHDDLTDTSGYIGYLPSNNSIYVSFRGSLSINNWLTDLDTTTTYYETFPECDCQVHAGFYQSVLRVMP